MGLDSYSPINSVPVQNEHVHDLRSSLLDLDDADFDILQSEPERHPLHGTFLVMRHAMQRDVE